MKTVLAPGVRAPLFRAVNRANPKYGFSSVAGRFIVLSFFGSSRQEPGSTFIKQIMNSGTLFDDEQVSFFGVTLDPNDYSEDKLQDRYPGIRFFFDLDSEIYRLYDVLINKTEKKGDVTFAPFTFVLDPSLRILKIFNWNNPEQHFAELKEYLDSLDRLNVPKYLVPSAPVLNVPRILEPEFCEHLISLYKTNGGEVSGFVKEAKGKSYIKVDDGFKRRRDYFIEDKEIRDAIKHRIFHRLLPEIERAYNFKCTKIERYIVACYDSETGGFFKPHKDNTTKATAHRRFAVTINLNADEYDGGNLRFPEYGRAEYRAETGGAIVFSCSLLHEATPIISGKRYATLPFLYDDEAAKIREQNNAFLDETIDAYTPEG
jgi:peroxiredoxin